MGSESRERKSIYDIIYCDRTRLAPLVSQLFKHGLPTNIAVKSHVGSSGNVQFSGSANAGWDELAKIEGSGSIDGTIDEHKENDTSFDPHWALALRFADQAVQHALRANFQIGRACVVSGSLSIVDYRTAKKVFSIPGLRKFMEQGIKEQQQGNAKERSASSKVALDNLSLFLEIVGAFADSTQAILSSDGQIYWMNVNREHLIFPPEEIVLRFGDALPGNWSVLGIYDSDTTEPVAVKDIAGVADVFRQVSPSIRQFVGKPVGSHSLTPLMIMREI